MGDAAPYHDMGLVSGVGGLRLGAMNLARSTMDSMHYARASRRFKHNHWTFKLSTRTALSSSRSCLKLDLTLLVQLYIRGQQALVPYHLT
eukprot:764402-Amphidinium_carterae.1